MAVRYIKRPDLPKPILDALMDPYYEEGLAEHFEQVPDKVKEVLKKNNHRHYSVTTLPRSPRQRQLFARHSDKVLLDPLHSGFWRMFGHTVHEILQKYPQKGDLVEVRLGQFVEVEVNGILYTVYVHGQLDRYEGRRSVVQDWKITRALAMLHADKKEYHAQLNMNSWLARKDGYRVKGMENVYLFRDWMPRLVKDDPADPYPKEQIQVVPVPDWGDDMTLKYIKERIKVHIEAESKEDDELPECTDQERWKGLPTYRVYKMDKEGNRQKRAKHVTASKLEAGDWTDEEMQREKLALLAKNAELRKPKAEEEVLAKLPSFETVMFPARSVRCEFCEIASFCGQRKAELAEMMQSQDPEDEDG